MADEKLDLELCSLVIYQNDPFINGLYESIYGARPESAEESDTRHRGSAGEGHVKGSGGVPLIGKAEMSASATGELKRERGLKRTMTFSQAFYLHHVRRKLYEANSLKQYASVSDFDALSYGDFVEFRGHFERNELIDVLNIVTPEMGGLIGAAQQKKNDSIETPDDLRSRRERSAAIGRSVVESLQKEFRNETTSEFYGRISNENGSVEGLGAVVICDDSFFASSDSDRILDGDFKVVGKVISKSADGTSKLDRNRLLKRITGVGKKQLTDAISKMKGMSDFIDTNIDLDFRGRVIKVIPIAIYV